MAFGKYQLLQRLRAGGMAEVWKAHETGRPERTVALKRILPSFTDEADYVAMFIDEARLGMRLSHANIVRAHELGQIEDEHYIALELVEGQDLGAIMRLARERQEPLPTALVCRIAIELCSALHYAHELRDEHGAALGIVHRDVSPQNVLISYDGDVKLLDFGIAKSSEQLMRTQAGLLKGKHGYLSPEQALGQQVDRRSDVFSLGVCLYELLSARRLFQGSSDFSTIVRVRTAQVPALESVNRDVPEALATIVHRALARERGARFQTALELQRELIGFVEQRAISCDRDALAHYLRARFARDAAPSAEATAAPDESTGLLAAFDAVEPPSALSALSELPSSEQPASVVHEERLDPGDPAVREGWGGDEDQSFAALADDAGGRGEPLREWVAPATVTPVAPAPMRSAARGERNEHDEGDEPITDRPAARAADQPTRVVSYESTRDGQLAQRAEPTRIDRRTPPVGEAPAANAAATNGADPRPSAVTPVELNAIALEWADEELSTQIYDPPPGQEDLVGAAPRRAEEPTRRTRPTPTPTPIPRNAAVALGLAPTPLILPQSAAPTPRVTMSSSPPMRTSAPILTVTDARPSAAPARVSSPPLGDARSSVPTPRGSLSPFGPPARSSVPPARVSLPPPGALPTPASLLHPELRVSMPPMGSNRSSSAPIRTAPTHEHGPSRAALGWAAGAVAMIVAAVVALLAWFGRPAPAILHVTTDPVDAVVTVDGVALSGTSSPFVATDMAPDVDHEIEVSRAGYHSWRTRLRLHAGRVLALPRIELQREEGTSTRSLDQPSLPQVLAAPVQQQVSPAARPPVTPSKSVPPASSPSHNQHPQPVRVRDHGAPKPHETKAVPTPKPVSAAPKPAPVAASDDPNGTLRVNSRPWSRVYIDGRMVGNTPQMQLSLAAGWHTVTLVNPDFGLQKVLTIRIKPGELITKIIDLQDK